MGFANAQTEEELQGRVGVNTKTPKASLDISRHTDLPETRAQGVLFPKFSTADRDKFTNTEVGTMIYNTDKKCLEMYMGVVSGVHQWSCLPDAGSAQQQNLTVTPVGFDGSFVQGVALSTSNKAKFKIVNNSFVAINNIDFSSAVSIQNGTANITATGVNANNVSLASGAERILEYTLSGSPENGTLTANFSRLGLTASQNTTVGMGRASINNKEEYVVSLTHNGVNVQGKINNTTHKLTIKIPYTGGQGSYSGFSNTQTTASGSGQGGDSNTLTLNIPAGNYGVNGELTATITVGGADQEFLVKMLAPGEKLPIATFPVNMNGVQFNVQLVAIGGVPDRRFSESANHKFIYIPIEVTGANGYRKTWLNNNLGAEYADANNPRGNFNPTKQATAHNDYKAYGSLYQWQRPSDGHELVTWTSATAGTLTPTTSAYSTNANWTAGHSKFIVGSSSNRYAWVDNTINVNTSKHNLWQENGSNNPCPVGYHVPTAPEWNELRTAMGGGDGPSIWTTSALRLPTAGQRTFHTGEDGSVGLSAYYWTSSPGLPHVSSYFYFGSGITGSRSTDRAHGFSVRCLKD